MSVLGTTVEIDNATKRILANRQNALKSTGPRTAEGKRRVSMNAFKHGLSGQNLCLQADECIPYFRLALDFIEDLRPVGVREEQLAQKVIDGNWRLNRAAAIENNLLNNDTVREAYRLTGEDERSVALAGQANAWRSDCAGARALESLGRHEGRIARTLFKMTAEFDALQARRLKRNKDEDTFIRKESRAWIFLSTALTHYQAAAAQQPASAAEESPETLHPQENAATSEVGLNCEFSSASEEDQPESSSYYEDLRTIAASMGIPFPVFTEDDDEPVL